MPPTRTPSSKTTEKPSEKPTTTPPVAPVVSPNPVAEEKRAAPTPSVPTAALADEFANVTLETVKDENPFATGSRVTAEPIAVDHPVVVMYKKTYEEQLAASALTNNPDGFITFVKRIATQYGKSVRISVRDADTDKRIAPGENQKYNEKLNGRAVKVRYMGIDRRSYGPRAPKETTPNATVGQ